MVSPDVEAAHAHCNQNRSELQQSTLCGCFHCLAIYRPTEIHEWVDEGRCALCPGCGIDSVLGDRSGYPITPEFLRAMEVRWFGLR